MSEAEDPVLRAVRLLSEGRLDRSFLERLRDVDLDALRAQLQRKLPPAIVDERIARLKAALAALDA